MRKSLAFCRRKNTKSQGNNKGKHSRDNSRRNSQPLHRDQLKLHPYATVQAPCLPPPPTSSCFFVRSSHTPPSPW